MFGRATHGLRSRSTPTDGLSPTRRVCAFCVRSRPCHTSVQVKGPGLRDICGWQFSSITCVAQSDTVGHVHLRPAWWPRAVGEGVAPGQSFRKMYSVFRGEMRGRNFVDFWAAADRES
eukprot:2623282-Prymnesium_polylepis.2